MEKEYKLTRGDILMICLMSVPAAALFYLFVILFIFAGDYVISRWVL